MGEGQEELKRPCSFTVILLYDILEDGKFGSCLIGKVKSRQCSIRKKKTVLKTHRVVAFSK